MTRAGLFVFLPLAAWSACTAAPQDNTGVGDEPPPVTMPGRDAGMAAAPRDMTQVNTGMVDPPRVVPPQGSTYWMALPIHGEGPAGGIVLIDAPTGSQVPANVSSNGQFCADVQLQPDALNEITLRAVDEFGNVSSDVKIHVQQSGRPPAQMQAQPATNAAIGGIPYGSLIAIWFDGDNTQVSSLNDGDVKTVYAGRGAVSSSPDYVQIQLVGRSKLSRLKITMPSTCLSAKYTVLLTNRDAPPTPSATDSAWSKLPSVTASTGADELTFSPRDTTGVALMFDDWGCGSVWPKHAIAEIEAWTAADMAPPPLVAPTCNGGG
jgi:hypothetical protein